MHMHFTGTFREASDLAGALEEAGSDADPAKQLYAALTSALAAGAGAIEASVRHASVEVHLDRTDDFAF